MRFQQGSRIDLGELKARIVKKIGVEKCKRYFYYLSRFLSQKLSKIEFDKSCYRLLGQENLPLHNQLILLILKNACQAKTPPSINEASLAKSTVQTNRSSPIIEDGFEQNGSLIPEQNLNSTNWSRGIFPVSPRKCRSGIRDRKLRDRPSSLRPNGKVGCLSHRSMGTKDNAIRVNMENGILVPCDYPRSLQHLQAVSEKVQITTAVIEYGEEVEEANQLNFSRTSLVAPLGISFRRASGGGAQKPPPVTSTSNFISCYDRGRLPDSETLRKRMEQIAEVEGLVGVSMDCADMLNGMLDMYLKKLIESCVELVRARSARGLAKKNLANKLRIQSKVLTGMWPGNNLQMQGWGVPIDFTQEQRLSQCLISMLDFKVAMELNPQQLGQDWPSVLERICMHSFKE